MERLMVGREWEAQTVAREDRERWSECGVGSLNSESEECRVIKEKEEVQEGNKRLEEKRGFEEEKGGAAFKISFHTHCGIHMNEVY